MNQILTDAIDRGFLAISLIRVCQAACHGTANGLHDQKDIELGGALHATLEHAQRLMSQNQDFMLERMEAILEAEISATTDQTPRNHVSGTYAHRVNRMLRQSGIEISGDILHDCMIRAVLAETGIPAMEHPVDNGENSR